VDDLEEKQYENDCDRDPERKEVRFTLHTVATFLIGNFIEAAFIVRCTWLNLNDAVGASFGIVYFGFSWWTDGDWWVLASILYGAGSQHWRRCRLDHRWSKWLGALVQLLTPKFAGWAHTFSNP
jgi:hypothetical protein